MKAECQVDVYSCREPSESPKSLTRGSSKNPNENATTLLKHRLSADKRKAIQLVKYDKSVGKLAIASTEHGEEDEEIWLVISRSRSDIENKEADEWKLELHLAFENLQCKFSNVLESHQHAAKVFPQGAGQRKRYVD